MQLKWMKLIQNRTRYVTLKIMYLMQKLRLPSIHWIGSSMNQLDIHNSMAVIPQPSLDPGIFLDFSNTTWSRFGFHTLFSALPEHSHRRGVTIFTQPAHRNGQADVHSTPVDLNGVAIQTMRRGVEHDLRQT